MISRKKIIALDLDDTLIHSFPVSNNSELKRLESKYRGFTNFNICMCDGKYENQVYFVCVRPGTMEFLEKLHDDFEVMFWSAGCPGYVNEIVEKLVPSRSRRPKLVYTSDDTYISEDRYKVVKELAKVPGATRSNIILIDDRDDVMCENPNQGIVIDPFDLENIDASLKDTELQSIMEKLRERSFWKNLKRLALK